MIKLTRIVLSVLCLMMLGQLGLVNSFARSASVSPVEQSKEEIFVKEGSGEVISVNTTAKTVVVKISQDENNGSFQEVALTIDDDTMITSQDSTLSISDLKAGNKVTVIYEEKSDGTNVAKSILVS